ncbi:MAG: TetR/AcrR family transcriptional regulator [Sneathiellales bacterium]|nr:TetR/AcrR family transcriptional regulator [Sneathiellales bacterium]
MPQAIEPKRKKATSAEKKRMILDAAKRVFEEEGLEGSSLRSIAAEAGYTPAALYFHFSSREEIYAELLSQSLHQLKDYIDQRVRKRETAGERFEEAAWSFFDFYNKNPEDLSLGLYLFRGGIEPQGVGRERNQKLNQELYDCLAPIAEAAEELGADKHLGQNLMARIFAHSTGILLLAHTKRIRLFEQDPEQMMRDYIEEQIKEQNWN